LKYKNILLAMAISLIAVGCGDSDNQKNTVSDSEFSDYELDRIKEKSIYSSVYQYMFGDTLKYSSSTKDTEHGVVTSEVKTIIRNIWVELEKKGFSGYDPKELEGEVTYDSNPQYILKRLSYPAAEPFHIRLMHVMALQTAWPNLTIPSSDIPPHKKTHFVDSLVGLKFNNQWVYDSEITKMMNVKYRGYIPVGIFTFSLAEPGAEPNREEGSKDTLISDAQLAEWNQVFVDEFKKDPFFRQFFEPAAVSDGSGSVSLLSARRGSTGVDALAFNVNGVSGSKVDLGLPMYVQLKGSVDHGKSTNLTTGTVAYKLGNTVVGAIQSYANSGTGFGSEGRQLETSIVASHSFGSFFIEGQLGSVSATDVRFKDWSGIRSQVTVGVDTSWVSPFVQVTHRDFGNTTDTATYAGFQMDISELNADTYAFSTHLFTKVGHHSVHGLIGALEWSGSLTLTSGVSFTSHLTLGAAAEPSAALNLTLDR
jgi:hypothetical protein